MNDERLVSDTLLSQIAKLKALSEIQEKIKNNIPIDIQKFQSGIVTITVPHNFNNTFDLSLPCHQEIHGDETPRRKKISKRNANKQSGENEGPVEPEDSTISILQQAEQKDLSEVKGSLKGQSPEDFRLKSLSKDFNFSESDSKLDKISCFRDDKDSQAYFVQEEARRMLFKAQYNEIISEHQNKKAMVGKCHQSKGSTGNRKFLKEAFIVKNQLIQRLMQCHKIKEIKEENSLNSTNKKSSNRSRNTSHHISDVFEELMKIDFPPIVERNEH
jgi:hypothetical protein